MAIYQRQIAYVDALKILGANDSKLLAGVDKILGGAILGATAVTGHLELLGQLDARSELIKQSGKLLSDFGQRARGARGKNRTDLLLAAHAVVAVNAYYEALWHVDLPLDIARLELTRTDQLATAGVSREQSGRSLVDALMGAPVPQPAPYRPYEQTLHELKAWYRAMSARLVDFIKGFSIWDELGES